MIPHAGRPAHVRIHNRNPANPIYELQALPMTDFKQTPWWWEAAEPASVDETRIDPSCDVVVVGAGFAGLSAAITLIRGGKSVQVFDADDPGRAASSRNGGMASGNLSFSLSQMISKFGADKARAFYAEGREARESLASFLADESIDCDFSMTGRFTGAMTPQHRDHLEKECADLNEHIGIDAWMISREAQRSEIGSDLYRGGKGCRSAGSRPQRRI